MIINEVRASKTFVHKDGTSYDILGQNGSNALLRNPKGDHVIALGLNSKTQEWEQGKYWGSNENGAFNQWDGVYNQKGAYGSEMYSTESQQDDPDRKLTERD